MASAIKIIAGLFIFLIGFPIFIGGSAVLLITPLFADSDGYFMTTTFHVDYEGVAAVRVDIPLEDVYIGVRVDPSDFVTFKLKARGPIDTPVFVGLTTDTEADEFLDSISYVRITNLEYFDEFKIGEEQADYTIDYSPPIANTTSWADPRTNDVTKWLVGGEDPGYEFKWPPTYEDLTENVALSLILMNDKAIGNSPEDSSVDIFFSVGARVPIINAIGWILVVFGGLLTLLSIIIIWSGLRTKKPLVDRVRYYQGAPAQRVEAVTKPTPKYHLQCSNCGSLNEPDSAFCSQCGEVLLSEDRKAIQDVAKEKEIEFYEPVGNKLVIAEGWPRFWAWLIDILITGAITSAISSLIFFSLNDWSWWSFGVWSPFQWLFSLGPSSVVFFLYVVLMEYYYGQTIGKMILNLEIVSERTGERPTLGEIAISSFGKAFLLPLDVFLGWIARDENQIPNLNQRLTQKLSRTVVILQQKKKEKTAQFVSSRV
ncbi:MAG: RDD family protein [Candidatus Hodarchaeota archaeon]